uniref:TNF superfamily member 8 n=1 Tax=Amazona collaria TaxID=241587 RepID=A0A8B9IZ94_9PSIT
MCSAQERTLFQMKDLHESAMHVKEDNVSRRLGATNRTCLYFIIATLVALLIFALATIMVLVLPMGKSLNRYLFIRKHTAAGHLRLNSICLLSFLVSNPVNSSKLSLVEKGICEDIQCKKEELVIKKQGLYLIYCHLNFHFPSCSNRPTDLKIELLVNDQVNRQTLSTWCACKTCHEKTLKTLFQLHMTPLNVKDRVSVTLNHPKFLDEIFLPNENVLGVLRYSDEM